MYTANISLSNIENVKKFVTIASKYSFNVTLYSEKYVINGKSIMGIFSLDLSKPIKLKIDEDCPDSFISEIKPFIISNQE